MPDECGDTVGNRPSGSPGFLLDGLLFADYSSSHRQWEYPETGWEMHYKPSPFAKQFCTANTAIFTLYATFQSFNKKMF